MLGEFLPVGFVHTTDTTRAQQVYVEVLGLDFIEESPFALVVRAGPTVIRITPVEEHHPSVHTVLGWSVPDAEAVMTELVRRGVEPLRFDGLTQDDLGIWDSPSGARVAWFSDSDGNTLSITQF